MIDVNAKEQVVYLSFVKGNFYGSVLIGGGKDVDGNNKPNGFMNVNFSNVCQDIIYDTDNLFENEETTKATIVCDFKGFLVHDEYKGKKEEKIIVTDVSNVKPYKKEEPKEEEKPTRPARRGVSK